MRVFPGWPRLWGSSPPAIPSSGTCRDPLPAGGRQAEIFHALFEMHRDSVPIKAWKLLNEVGRRRITELPVAAELLELVEKRVGLPRIQGVPKLPDQVGFTVLPRRWVVERFFAWINRNRRLAKDFEGTIASATAFVQAASVILLIRRLARP